MVSISHESRGTTPNVVRNLLLEDFLRGNFIPGGRLHMDELAERYSVSRTPIRQALMLLANEGILTYSGGGFEVRAPSFAEICEMYDIRCALECLAVGKLVANGVSPEVLQKLREIHEALLAAAADWKRQSQLDREFHEFICDHCGAPALSQLVRHYMVLSVIFNYVSIFMPERIRATKAAHRGLCRQHARILKGIESGDPEKAKRAVAYHINHARNYFEVHHID